LESGSPSSHSVSRSNRRRGQVAVAASPGVGSPEDLRSAHFAISEKAFSWIRVFSISLTLAWTATFAYLEAFALNYGLPHYFFQHFTTENLALALLGIMFGLSPFALTIRFGDPGTRARSLLTVVEIFCLGILAEDVSYFIILWAPIRPQDWTAQILGGFYLPGTTLFVPTWYALAAGGILLAELAVRRVGTGASFDRLD
jgi:hypothetical protein